MFRKKMASMKGYAKKEEELDAAKDAAISLKCKVAELKKTTQVQAARLKEQSSALTKVTALEIENVEL